MSRDDELRGPDRWIVVGGRPVPLRVRRSNRARRARLVVRPAEPLEVVLPRWAPAAEVDLLLREKATWLERAVAWTRTVTSAPPALDVARAGVVWLEGRPVPALRRPGPRSVARLAGSGLVVTGPDPAGAVERWYRHEARRRLTAAADREAARLGVAYRALAVRDPRTRWGSCALDGRLSFSWRLVLAPAPVLRSVVVHELCHVRHANHGPAFRRSLAAALPEWRESERWLLQHGHELHRFRPGDLPVLRGRPA